MTEGGAQPGRGPGEATTCVLALTRDDAEQWCKDITFRRARGTNRFTLVIRRRGRRLPRGRYLVRARAIDRDGYVSKLARRKARLRWRASTVQ